MEKFTVQRVKTQAGEKRMPLQIRQSTYNAIKQMANKTGRPITELVDEMTRYCSARFEVVE